MDSCSLRHKRLPTLPSRRSMACCSMGRKCEGGGGGGDRLFGGQDMYEGKGILKKEE